MIMFNNLLRLLLNKIEVNNYYHKIQKNIWGFGDWGLGPIPNPQSPIPNPQSPNPHIFLFNYENIYLS